MFGQSVSRDAGPCTASRIATFLLPILLLLFPPLLTSADASSAGNGGSWISFDGCATVNASTTGAAAVAAAVACTCQRTSRRELQCSLSPSDSRQPGPPIIDHETTVACHSAKLGGLASLTINCANYSHCAVLHLHRLAYHSSLVHLYSHHCRVDNGEDDGSQLSPFATDVSLVPDGVIKFSGAAGFFATVANGSRAAAAVDGDVADGIGRPGCELRRLTISDTELRFPTSLLYNCPGLTSLEIANSSLQGLTDADVLAMSVSSGVAIKGCGVHYFGEGLLRRALTHLSRQPLREDCVTDECRTFTAKAKAVIDLMTKTHSAFSDARKLYAIMDDSHVNFRLLMGRTVDSLNVPSPLSKLDLSNNMLSMIPSSLSMLGNLMQLNLSRNRIRSLYDASGCWGSPPSGIPLKKKTGRQCYWFRAARASLKVLDLSYNLIERLGQVEPWHEVNLWTLNLSNNRIATLGADAFTGSLSSSLNYLYIDNNLIKSMQLNRLTKVIVLSANNNQLSYIKNDTLPNSKALETLNLAGNYICSISRAVFKKYFHLYSLDLSGNLLYDMQYASFEMNPRQARSSRVLMRIGQRVALKCDCKHFFERTLREEQSDEHRYTTPQISGDERNATKCQLASKHGFKTFRDLKPSDFSCRFDEYSRIKLPKTVCNRNGTACMGKCNPHCQCWTSNVELNMNCTVHGIPQSARNIHVPVTSLDFSFVRTSFFQALCNDTFSWEHSSDADSLKTFRARGSNIVSIDDFAFNRTRGLTEISVPNNRIKRLTSRTFAGLVDLAELDLRYNNLSTISVNQVLQPLASLSMVTLKGNPFGCSCSSAHLNYLTEMAEYSRAKSVIRDYESLTCRLTDAFVGDFNSYDLSTIYTNVSLRKFPLQSVELLRLICHDMADRKSQLVMSIVKTTLITLGTAAGLVLAVVLVRRRHFICSLLAFTVLVRLIGRRRGRKTLSARKYDLFVFCADGNSDVLESVLDSIAKISVRLRKEPVQVCTTCNFLISDDPQSVQQLCEIESIDLAVMRSAKVMLVLSEELFRACTMQMVTIANAMGHSRMSRDLILMRLEGVDDVAQQMTQTFESLGSRQEREGLMVWMRILMGSQTVLYGSTDWQYKLINIIFRESGSLPNLSDSSGSCRLPSTHNYTAAREPLVSYGSVGSQYAGSNTSSATETRLV